MFIECSILRRTPPAFYTTYILSELGNALNSCHFNSSFISFTGITSIATHRTARPTPNYSWNIIHWKFNPSCTRWLQPLSGGGVSTVWCIDAQQARKQVLVTATHWPAAATWDAGHHSVLNELLQTMDSYIIAPRDAIYLGFLATDTGETPAPKVGHEMSHVINAPSYTYHEEWW